MLLDILFKSTPDRDPLNIYFNKALAEIAIYYYIINADKDINTKEKQFVDNKINDYLNNTYIPEDFRNEVRLIKENPNIRLERIIELLDRLNIQDAENLLCAANEAARADANISSGEDKRLRHIDKYITSRKESIPFIDEEYEKEILSQIIVEKSYTCENCGANMKFKSNLTKIVCPFCGTERKIIIKE
ncbi:MAG: hypothetical protein MJ153_01060 [Clostridia bacterium]|nr:hypothetical protein [Clostridia bacterium]